MKIQQITVLYASGDANLDETRMAVGAAMRQAGLDGHQVELTEVLVFDKRGANAERMIGSPTVRVNDLDIEGRTVAVYTNKPRQYQIDGRFVAAPTAELIAEAIARVQALPERPGAAVGVGEVSLGKRVPAQLPPI